MSTTPAYPCPAVPKAAGGAGVVAADGADNDPMLGESSRLETLTGTEPMRPLVDGQELTHDMLVPGMRVRVSFHFVRELLNDGRFFEAIVVDGPPVCRLTTASGEITIGVGDLVKFRATHDTGLLHSTADASEWLRNELRANDLLVEALMAAPVLHPETMQESRPDENASVDFPTR